MAIDAAGVHLGVHGMSVSMARKLLGENKIIGSFSFTYSLFFF
jgi:thiamine monophosphate synthase